MYGCKSDGFCLSAYATSNIVLGGINHLDKLGEGAIVENTTRFDISGVW